MDTARAHALWYFRCLVETVRSTASTVGITLAVVPAGRVSLLTVVPTSAVANLLRQLADLGVCVEHLALCAPKLVGGLQKVIVGVKKLTLLYILQQYYLAMKLSKATR